MHCPAHARARTHTNQEFYNAALNEELERPPEEDEEDEEEALFLNL